MVRACCNQLWEELLRVNATSSTVYLEAIRAARRSGRVDRCRNLFRRAITRVGQDTPTVLGLWIQFEQDVRARTRGAD